MTVQAAAHYALLSDGSTLEIRAARPQDAGDARRMHEEMSPDNAYLRFFSLSPLAADREAVRLCRPEDDTHAALLAWLDDRLVGAASYEPTGRPGVAEIAFAVADEMHGRGVATLLLEHLVSLARQRHLTAFAAETLPENLAMQHVFADAGLPVERHYADGVVELCLPLPGTTTPSSIITWMWSAAAPAGPTSPALTICCGQRRWRSSEPGGGADRSAGRSCRTSCPAASPDRCTQSIRAAGRWPAWPA